jgi:hypothetical protein
MLNKIVTESMIITPDIAREMLKCNENNRKLDKLIVDKYSHDIKNGKWRVNGETIKFSKNGRLIDGQHRLAACVMADREFTGLIVKDLDEEVFDTIDIGKKKTIGNHLHTRGESNVTTLGATMRLLYYWEKGILSSAYSYVSKPSNLEMQNCLDRNPGLRESVTKVNSGNVICGAAGAFTHYVFGLSDPLGRDEFFAQTNKGIELVADMPTYLLRERLTRYKKQMNLLEKLALVIKAWNYHKAGKRIKTLRWRGADGEEFPEIC